VRCPTERRGRSALRPRSSRHRPPAWPPHEHPSSPSRTIGLPWWCPSLFDLQWSAYQTDAYLDPLDITITSLANNLTWTMTSNNKEVLSQSGNLVSYQFVYDGWSGSSPDQSDSQRRRTRRVERTSTCRLRGWSDGAARSRPSATRVINSAASSRSSTAC